jgi:hypothetical protein
MFELSQLLFFVGAASPCCSSRSGSPIHRRSGVHQGRLAGLVSVLGIETAAWYVMAAS